MLDGPREIMKFKSGPWLVKVWEPLLYMLDGLCFMCYALCSVFSPTYHLPIPVFLRFKNE
jgi:hypothetical protein